MALNQTFNQDSSGNIGLAGSVSTAAPSYTNGTYNGLSLTLTGLLRIDGSGVTQPISASTLPLPTGAATEATLAKLTLAQGSTTSGQSGPLVQGAVTTASPTYTTAQTSPLSLTTAGALRIDGSAVTQPISAASLPLPTGAATSALQTSGNATLTAISGQLPPALGPQTTAASLSIVPATGATFAVTSASSATATPTSVSITTSSQTLLASNSSRKGAIIYNDGLAILYVGCFTTSSVTSFTYKLQPGSAANIDFSYTGVISGIGSAALGSARVTEFT